MKRYKVFVFILILFPAFLFAQDNIDIFSLPGGTISVTNSPASVGNLIDGDINTEYGFTSLSNEIIFSAPGSFTIKKYSLTSSSQSNSFDPKDWKLEGSLDKENWTQLHMLTYQAFSERKFTRTFDVTNSQPYTYFRLKINATQGGGQSCVLSEWRLYGEKKAMPVTPTNAVLNPKKYNEIKLSWRDNSDNEDGFEIQRTLNGVNYQPVATVPANTTSYADKNVNSNTPYIYRVCATLDGAKTPYSVSNSILTPAFQPYTSLTLGRNFTATDQRNSSPAGEQVGNLFDDDNTTKFLTSGSSTWIKLEFDEAYKVEQYSLTSANDAAGRDPKNWKLEASENGSEWTVLDTKENEIFDLRYQKRFFEIDNSKAYKFYRLTITKNNGEGNTQLADWLVYADVPPVTSGAAPATPSNFNIDIRAFNTAELKWNDVSGETSYRLERYANGVLERTDVIGANNTRCYPYAMKAETNYEFKLFALNGEVESLPATVSGRTPAVEWIETWENLVLWINGDKPVTVKKVRETSERVAFYMLEKDSPDEISDIYYEAYTENWEYVQETYGDVLSDPRLHVILFPDKDENGNGTGGGVASIGHYRDSPNYRNMVYIRANADWFKGNSKEGFVYDVMAHEICHIIEGIGGGYNGSMFYPVWGDSKWAEIFQYDIFQGVNSPRAATWHAEYTQGSKPMGGAEFPNSERTSYWYRDFFYPVYANHGGAPQLVKFWRLLQEHYKQKNGDFQGSSENPGGRGNLGEMIHFWSGSAGVDVKSYAVDAFGWTEQFEMWLMKAKADYPQVTYPEKQIEISEKNICQNGGTIISNRESTDDIKNLIDNNYSTSYLVKKGTDTEPYSLVYSSAIPAAITKYVLRTADSSVVPSSVKLYASMDNRTWVLLDEQETPDFSDGNKLSIEIDNEEVYQYFKLEFQFKRINQIRMTEIELWGVEYSSTPTNLRAKKVSENAVYIDWSCSLDEVDYYKVERSVDGINFIDMADVERYEISYTDENLDSEGIYYYRVTAKNKNSLKKDAVSDIISVDMKATGLIGWEQNQPSFYELMNNLDLYPDNNVQVYSITGMLVFDKHYGKKNLLNDLRSNLLPGVYVVKIDARQDAFLPVSNKIVIK